MHVAKIVSWKISLDIGEILQKPAVLVRKGHDSSRLHRNHESSIYQKQTECRSLHVS